jgi:hypothetical protein
VGPTATTGSPGTDEHERLIQSDSGAGGLRLMVNLVTNAEDQEPRCTPAKVPPGDNCRWEREER